MNEISITVTPTTSWIDDARTTKALRNHLRVRPPGFMFSPAYKKKRWDGYVYPITKQGRFSTGLLPRIVYILETGIDPETKEEVVVETATVLIKNQECVSKEFVRLYWNNPAIEAKDLVFALSSTLKS